MEDFYKRWLLFVNRPFDINNFYDEISNSDMCVNYNGKFYICKEPCNDPWTIFMDDNDFTISNECPFNDFVQVCLLNNEHDEHDELDELVNVLTWNTDITLEYNFDDVKHLSKYFNLSENDDVIYSLVPDVQSELPIEYYPQYLFPFHRMENESYEDNYHMFFYNVKNHKYILYGFDDTVNGIQIFDSYEELYKEASHICLNIERDKEIKGMKV